MSITLHPPTTAGLSAEELLAWRTVPVSVAVDLEPAAQVDPALRAVTRPDLPLALIGPALTIACTPPDFGAVVKALDEARPSQVVVIDAGGHLNHAVIGEILGGHLRAKGCAGLVVDGAVRDIAELGSWSDFPVFARSINPRGPTSAQYGAINAAVTLGGVSVESGDLIIGDRDGLAVLSPKVARRLLADAQAKLTLEAEWIEGLASGQSAAEIFGV